MHLEAYAAVAQMVALLPWVPKRVIEVGSYDVNGSVRPLFPEADSYIGLDRRAGPGVDVVADALTYTPDGPVDLVVCCEVLEHDPHALALVAHLLRWPTRAVALTFATPQRAPHSCDGGPVLAGEWYAGVRVEDVCDVIRRHGATVVWAEDDSRRGDGYVLAHVCGS